MEAKRESVFMQMHRGERRMEGSFDVALQQLFYKADQPNRRKLVAAFPEFFGEEVPEFGVYKKKPQVLADEVAPCEQRERHSKMFFDKISTRGGDGQTRTALTPSGSFGA